MAYTLHVIIFGTGSDCKQMSVYASGRLDKFHCIWTPDTMYNLEVGDKYRIVIGLCIYVCDCMYSVILYSSKR